MTEKQPMSQTELKRLVARAALDYIVPGEISSRPFPFLFFQDEPI